MILVDYGLIHPKVKVSYTKLSKLRTHALVA
jgi:hypothetical protein